MNNINFGNKRLLGEFVQCYVERAFELAEKGLSSDEFDNNLFSSVAKDCELDRQTILMLHMPFHWAFFNSGNGSSPFQMVYSKNLDGIYYIKLVKENYNEREKQEAILGISNKVIDTYGNTIIKKMERMINPLS